MNMNSPAHFDLSFASKLEALVDAPKGNVAMHMGTNIGRDVLKRARGFLEISTAMFEYLANAYESYNFGDDLRVFVDIKKNKVVIRDFGVGMNVQQIIRYWTMHGETSRRENGLNMRGYNGTGKIAAFRFAEQMEVRTVHNGLRQTTRLTLASIEKAARTGGQIDIESVEINVPTTEANGTTVTISNAKRPELPEGFNAAFIRDIREKVSKEMMMWMKGAKFVINGTDVEAQAVPSDRTERRYSDCGNFWADFHEREAGYKDELPKVFISIGDIFVAHEMLGKENHRLGHRVHVAVNTTREWSDANFFHRRELFVTEARDLKLRPSCDEAHEFKNWVEACVSGYMKEMADAEDERRREQSDEYKREMESHLSMQLSALFRSFNQTPSTPRTPTERTVVSERTPRGPNKPKISFHSEKFSNDEERYRFNVESNEITVNELFPTLAIFDDNKSVVYRQALIETGIAALVEMQANKEISEKFAEGMPTLDVVVSTLSEMRKVLERKAYGLMATQFESFKKLSVTKVTADGTEAQ
jgi:hypothetical protein